MKKLNKLAALVMALVMALALAAPVMAEDITSSDSSAIVTQKTLSGTNNTQLATIKLKADFQNQVVFNPYKLKAKVLTSTGAKTDGASGTEGTDYNVISDQVIAKTASIQNQSDVPLRMAVTLAVDLSGADGDNGAASKATVATSAPANSVTAKTIYLYSDFAVFSKNDPDEYEDRPDIWLTSQRLTAKQASFNSATPPAWDGTSGGAIQVKNNAGGIYIPVPDEKMATTDNNPSNFVLMKIGGAATLSPAIEWKASDVLNVYVAYQFYPQGTSTLYKLRAGATDSSATTTSVSPVAFTALNDDTGVNGVPTFTVPYKAANLNVTWADTDSGEEAIWETDTDDIVGQIEAGTVVTIHAPVTPAGSTANASDGKKGKITVPVFYNMDGTKNTAVKATIKNSKDATSDWTFTMPAQNIYVMMTVENSPAYVTTSGGSGGSGSSGG